MGLGRQLSGAFGGSQWHALMNSASAQGRFPHVAKNLSSIGGLTIVPEITPVEWECFT
jgi:hypothetical protein